MGGELGAKKQKELKMVWTSLSGVCSNLLVNLPSKLQVQLEGQIGKDESTDSQNHDTGNQVRNEAVEDAEVKRQVILGISQVGEGVTDLEVLEN